MNRDVLLNMAHAFANLQTVIGKTDAFTTLKLNDCVSERNSFRMAIQARKMKKKFETFLKRK